MNNKYPKQVGVCKNCLKPIIAKNVHFDKPNRIYCSFSCRTTWRNKNTPKTQKQLEMIIRVGKNKKGKKESLETRLKKSESQKGEKSHFWKGGLTDKNRLLRNSFEAKQWRIKVYERDNYTCQICGIRSGKGIKALLEADHIKPWYKHPELRFDINNGRTLCKSCHRKTDTFGRKVKKYELQSIR